MVFLGYGRFLLDQERPIDSAQNSIGCTDLFILNKGIFSRVRDGEPDRTAKNTRVIQC